MIVRKTMPRSTAIEAKKREEGLVVEDKIVAALKLEAETAG